MSKLKLEVLFGAVDKLTGPMKTIIGRLKKQWLTRSKKPMVS